MNPSSRQHHAPRSLQTSLRPSQTEPRSYCCHSTRWHVLQGNRDEKEPWRDLLCGMSEVRDRTSPSLTPLLILFSPARLKIKCDKQIPCQSCQVCPTQSLPFEPSFDPPCKAERLCFFVSERSVVSSIFRSRIMIAECTLDY